MKAKLVVVGGDAKAAEINLKLPTIIGRGREAALTLPHPLVSRQHCEIYAQDEQLVIRDMGSLNGTFINNQRIEEPTFLPSGDLLTIGAVTFRAVYGDDFENSVAAIDNGDSANIPVPKQPSAQKKTGDANASTTQEGTGVDQVNFEALESDVDELAGLGKQTSSDDMTDEVEEWDDIFEELEDEDKST